MKEIWYPGDRFPNGWVINKIIDRGGMGTVYIVRHPDHNLPLAAKTFKQEFFSRVEMIERFRREAEVWMRLGAHRHIVQAHFVESIEGKPYVFLEYVPGSNLHELLVKGLDVHRALAFAIQFCDGMAFVHGEDSENGGPCLLHCDIKPANVMIGTGEVLKITDFGLAKEMADRGTTLPGTATRGGVLLSQTGDLRGTLAYMSPEHFQGPRYIEKRSDIYSFGVLLFEMLTGKLPFDVGGVPPNEIADVYRHLHQRVEPPAPCELRPELSRDLEALVLTCLEKDPAERPHDFLSLREVFQDLYSELVGRPLRLEPRPEEQEMERAHRFADSYYHLGQMEQALEWCEKALELDPESADAWNRKGLSHYESRQYEEALKCFEQVLRVEPRSDGAWNNKAITFKALKDFDTALSCCDQALALDHDDWQSMHNKGTILDDWGRREESLIWFERCLEINPWHVNAWSSKANVLQKLGRNEEALLCVEKALEINPRDANSVNNKIVILTNLEHFNEAIQWSDHLIELDPRYPAYWVNKVSILLRMSRYDDAVATIDEGLDTSPHRGRLLETKLAVLTQLAEVRATPEAHRRVNEAVEELLAFDPDNETGKLARTAIEVAISPMPPGSPEAAALRDRLKALQGPALPASEAKQLNLQGEALLNLRGDDKGAAACFRRAIELDPTLMDSYNNLGVVLERQGDIDGAIAAYDKTIERAPAFHMPWNNKGNCYLSRGELGQALACFDRAVALNPDFSNSWIGRGATLLETHQVEEALASFERALAIDPGRPEAEHGRMLCRQILDRFGGGVG